MGVVVTNVQVEELPVPPEGAEGDIPDLAWHLLGRIRVETKHEIHHISPEAMKALQSYDWPGNVRELENALTRACILARGATLGPEHLRLGSDRPTLGGGPEGESAFGMPDALAGASFGASGDAGPDWTLDGAIGRQVFRVLEHTHWNKSEAARLLKISRSRLARLLEKFDLESQKE
jgi:DNA-binding NtrC family response regulator